MPNRLIHETSPYLLQHAHNPVDWFPWSDDAFARARAEGKPLLLSIGYSACHWCHVMERESFEDADTAALMNDLFVNMKVDREERPDLDEIYMSAVQGMTGRGGWPMTVFLTPEGKPFFGGTYFPPTDRPGMPAFRRVLQSVAQAYHEQPDKVAQQADSVVRFIEEQSRPGEAADHLDSTILDSAFVNLSRGFDPIHGGFGGAPKFPQAMALEFLLRYHARSGNSHALHMVELSLQQMARGGIYDHLGGGFHRYSVDDHWLVPHFEKMLYDNALLAQVYLHAYQVTGNLEYQQVVEETLAHLARDVRLPGGGFAGTIDADSEGEEGAYYVWTPAQLEAVLGKSEAEIAARWFRVTAAGNFEGKTILTRDPLPPGGGGLGRGRENPLTSGASTHEGTANLIAPTAAGPTCRPRLLAARQQRVPPDRDEKIICSWNSLALRTFAEAYRCLGTESYRQIAEVTADLLLDHLWQAGRLHRTFKDGRTGPPGFLEDYAGLADALLALYEATFSLRWYQAAVELIERLVDLFWDETTECFRDTARDAESLVVRPRERWDNATPSGTSLACHALLRLWALTNRSPWEAIARQALAHEAPWMEEHPSGLGNLLCALDLYLGPPVEVAVVGDLAIPGAAALLAPLHQAYLPNLVLAAAHIPVVLPSSLASNSLPPFGKLRAGSGGGGLGRGGIIPSPLAGEGEGEGVSIPLLSGREPIDGRPTAYVCRGFVCDLPTTDPAVLRTQLGLPASP